MLQLRIHEGFYFPRWTFRRSNVQILAVYREFHWPNDYFEHWFWFRNGCGENEKNKIKIHKWFHQLKRGGPKRCWTKFHWKHAHIMNPSLLVRSSRLTILNEFFVSIATMPVWPTSDGHFEAATLIIAPCRSAFTTALLNASYVASCTSGIRCSAPSPIKYNFSCCRMYCFHRSCNGTISAYFNDLVGSVYKPISANCLRDSDFDGLPFLRASFLDNCFLLLTPVRTVRCCVLMERFERLPGATRSVTKSTICFTAGSSARMQNTIEISDTLTPGLGQFIFTFRAHFRVESRQLPPATITLANA